ncbi:hypothetical protein T439DRAFT_377289 [Meredithblackwellia eburnea MCA 4105]
MPREAVRSRSGCSTCRRRRKKCDETWDDPAHVGVCKRCFVGSFTCDRSPIPRQPAKPRKALPTPTKLHSPPDSVAQSLFLTGSSASTPAPTMAPAPVASTSTAQFFDPAMSQPPYSFPELDTEPFMANFFATLDSISFPADETELQEAADATVALQGDGELGVKVEPSELGDEEEDEIYDEASAAGALVGLPQAFSRAQSLGKSPASQSSPPLDPILPSQSSSKESPISPLYNKFNDEFLASIPNPLRKILTKNVDDVVAQHELTRMSSLAVVLLYRARSLPNASEQRARLIEQSDEQFHAALSHLQVPIPLEAQITAVLDLQYHQFALHGGAASHAVLLLGEFFVTETLGTFPKLDFASMMDPTTLPLRCFAYTEILTAFVTKDRRSVFDVVALPGDEEYSSPVGRMGQPPADPRLETHLGLPVGLLMCLVAITNLSLDMAKMDPLIVQEKKGSIERAIRNWQVRKPPVSMADSNDSVSYLDELRLAEIWRHTALIHLYESVHHLGPHARQIRHSLSQIIALGHRNADPNATDYGKSFGGSLLACPFTIASMVATSVEDREKCRQVLVQCGPQMGYQTNLAAVEKVWATVDETGFPVDWRSLLAKEGMMLAFL